MQSATLVSNCHDIQFIIYLLCISVPARWLTVFLQSWCLDLCFLCTQSWGPCCPSPTSCDDLRWPLQDPDCPPEPRFYRHNPFNITSSCHSSKINSIRNKNVIIHWITESQNQCAGQEMYAELDLNSTKHHLIGQIHLMLTGHKLTWKYMVQCALSGTEFSMFQQCVVRVDVE